MAVTCDGAGHCVQFGGQRDVWMDGWRDGWMDGWMDGGMDGGMNGEVGGGMDGGEGGWRNGWRMDGGMVGWRTEAPVIATDCVGAPMMGVACNESHRQCL